MNDNGLIVQRRTRIENSGKQIVRHFRVDGNAGFNNRYQWALPPQNDQRPIALLCDLNHAVDYFINNARGFNLIKPAQKLTLPQSQ